MRICVFVVISLISLSLFTDVLSRRTVPLCQSLCCGHAVRAYSTSFSETGFPPSSSHFSFLSSSPAAATPPWGRSVCRRDALDGFFAVSWGILWFLIQLSSSIRRGSRHSPRSLTAMLGSDESHKMQDQHFSVILSNAQTPDILFISSNLALLFSPLILPFLFPPTPSFYFQ